MLHTVTIPDFDKSYLAMVKKIGQEIEQELGQKPSDSQFLSYPKIRKLVTPQDGNRYPRLQEDQVLDLWKLEESLSLNEPIGKEEDGKE